MIFWQHICCQTHGFMFLFISSVSVNHVDSCVGCVLFHVHTHGKFLSIIINPLDLLRENRCYITMVSTCIVNYQMKKLFTLSLILLDQGNGITVYSHSIWQDCKDYHKDSQNPVCFGCYVVFIPVRNETLNDNCCDNQSSAKAWIKNLL